MTIAATPAITPPAMPTPTSPSLAPPNDTSLNLPRPELSAVVMSSLQINKSQQTNKGQQV